MKHLFLSLQLTLAATVFTTPAFAENTPGLVERKIEAPHHGSQMDLAVWYPAMARTSEGFAENPIFVGGDVFRNAAPLPGKHPIILMSHGMGGSYLTLNWLASGLAARGAVVVSVNHPNGWFRDRKMDKMFYHWTRVQDLQVALDTVLADPTFSADVDPNRIYAAGFSFGGWTALSIGGVTGDSLGSFDYCKAAGSRLHDCTDLKFYGVDPAKLDSAKWTASYKDPRIKAVASLDPGLTWKLDKDNVRDVDQSRLLIIGLGSLTERHYATDTTIHGSGFDTWCHMLTLR